MIHYHGTPTGGTRKDTVQFLKGRHAMVSFARPDDLPAALEVCQSLCLDNGAFSAWKKGTAIDPHAYATWVESIMRHPAFDWAIIPDVIDGSEKDNDRLISHWPWGHVGVPVWHLHESIARLRFLCGAWPRVALGSSGQWSTPGTPEWWRRMCEALHAVCMNGGQPVCKLHGLRMLNPDIFTRLPLSSADSTNAVRNGNLVTRFGMYCPPTLGQRIAVIADRIEANQSAPCWKPFGGVKEGLLFDANEQAAAAGIFTREDNHVPTN